jgi:hypothetical protein
LARYASLNLRAGVPVTYTRHQLPALLNWIFERLHENDVMLAPAKECYSWVQAWFMPCMPVERAHLFKTWWRVGGKSLDKTDVSEWFEPVAPFDVAKICADYQNKQSLVDESIPAIAPVARVPMANLSANPIEFFNGVMTVHDVLIRNGYKQTARNRYLHPNSSSKIAGVRILDNGRAYSDSSDSLNDGKSHDAFDCFRLLECGGDMKTALNWNSDITRANQRAFYEVPETAKPHDISINAVSKSVVKSHSCIGLQADNTLISTTTRCENSATSSV